MAIEQFRTTFSRLDDDRIDRWKSIPTSVVGDSLNRQQVMASRLKPLIEGKMVGQALTVSVVGGDNGAIHAAMTVVRPNQILVIDGNNYTERALWGGILNKLALRKKIGGVVIDGAVRDISDLRSMKLPIYFSAVTPAGPHKGWGGRIGSNISCGGISVSSGDIGLGDSDGVVVVPLAAEERVFKIASALLRKEEEIMSKVESGEDLTDIFQYPKIETFSP